MCRSKLGRLLKFDHWHLKTRQHSRSTYRLDAIIELAPDGFATIGERILDTNAGKQLS
jgi:hypothetical protein